jgi:Carboxypeptidase regulatory-like domain
MVVKGRVLDTKGQPLAGAVIHTAHATSNSVAASALTDAQGNYRITKMALDVPYYAYAWVDVTYRDKRYCLRVAPADSAGYNNYYARDGAILNFQWKLQGHIDDSSYGPEEDGSWYGGSIRLSTAFADSDYDSTLELKLTPTAPLIDGSTGSVITKIVDLSKTHFVLDIPAGAYKLSATRVKSDGTRVTARLGPQEWEAYAEYDFEVEPTPVLNGCGGAYALSGLARGFVYVVSP